MADIAESRSPEHKAVELRDGGGIASRQEAPLNHEWRTGTIVLATTIPSVVLIVIAAVMWRRARKRRSRLFNRGITPIDDREIESWKGGRGGRYGEEDEEKQGIPVSPPRRQPSDPRGGYVDGRAGGSAAMVQKSASVIVYQKARLSEDGPPPPSPGTAHGKRSVDVVQTPVLARAPNSRPGLTDETVQGAEAFIRTWPAKQPSLRLATAPPTLSPRTSPRHGRSKSTRATMTGTTGGQELWYGQQQTSYQPPPRRSADTLFPPSPSQRGRGGTLSSRSTPTRTSFEDEYFMGGLSPRPLIHKSEIGRAIG